MSVNCERVFLGWSSPLLPQAARWLIEGVSVAPAQRARSQVFADLGDVLVVLPGRRAARRLLELLAGDPAVGSYGLVPPRIVTPSELPELLYDSEQRLASKLEQRLCWLDAIQRLPDEIRSKLCPAPPERDDLLGWLAIVAEFETLDADLSGAGLSWRQARESLASAGLYDDSGRWQTLVELRGRVEQALNRRGAQSKASARLSSLVRKGHRRGGASTSVVLIGVVDLPSLFRRLLEASALPTVTLIQAPATEANSFDDWGCPQTQVWSERRLELGGAGIEVTEDPSDEVAAVVQLIRGWTQEQEELTPQEISVGLGDESKARRLADALDVAGIASHSPLGRSLLASRPAALLETVARYLRTRRLRDLAALMRLPDFENYALTCEADLRQVTADARGLVESGRLGRIERAIEERDLLTALDLYTTESLPVRVDPGGMPGHPLGAALTLWLDRLVHQLVDQQPERPEPKRTLSQWAPRIVAVLERIFSEALDPRCDSDAEVIQSLELLAEELRQHYRLSDDGLDLMPATFDQAVAIALADAPTLFAADGAAATGVELLGWLELALDDAAALIVTDLNEGTVPRNLGSDQLLPNSARAHLGLLHDQRRYARDAFVLTTLLQSRRRLALLLARRDGDGSALRPSRLLLAQGPEEQAREVIDLLRPRPRSMRSALWHASDETELSVPRPLPLEIPIEGLAVTAFRDYLSCPYRFYLRHALGLRVIRDLPRELDAGLFGELCHEVLRRFGADPAVDSSDSEEILVFLLQSLREEVVARFGTQPTPAARVQLAQLERRLETFAAWHAAQRRAGWRVRRDLVELRLCAELEVDGSGFEVVGRIDRVDEHAELGQRIIDYKTGDRPRHPHEVHRRAGEWIDLQLPLYRMLARQAGVAADAAVGFVAISKKLEHSELFLEARWTEQEHGEALECARDVVRDVRAQRFWPPAEPPSYDDGLGWICGDTLSARHRVGLATDNGGEDRST